MTSSMEGNRDLRHSVWFGGFKANVSPASFRSIWCYSILDAATAVQSTAWPGVCAHTPPHLSETNIWNNGPRAHGIVCCEHFFDFRSSFAVVSQIAGAQSQLRAFGHRCYSPGEACCNTQTAELCCGLPLLNNYLRRKELSGGDLRCTRHVRNRSTVASFLVLTKSAPAIWVYFTLFALWIWLEW